MTDSTQLLQVPLMTRKAAESLLRAEWRNDSEPEWMKASDEAREAIRAALEEEAGGLTERVKAELYSDPDGETAGCGGSGEVTITETGREPDGTPYPYPALARCPGCRGCDSVMAISHAASDIDVIYNGGLKEWADLLLELEACGWVLTNSKREGER